MRGSFQRTPRYASCGQPQLAYNQIVRAVFVELPSFERRRAEYLDEEAFRALQHLLMTQPEAGT
jgi:hypothetical protein